MEELAGGKMDAEYREKEQVLRTKHAHHVAGLQEELERVKRELNERAFKVEAHKLEQLQAKDHQIAAGERALEQMTKDMRRQQGLIEDCKSELENSRQENGARAAAQARHNGATVGAGQSQAQGRAGGARAAAQARHYGGIAL